MSETGNERWAWGQTGNGNEVVRIDSDVHYRVDVEGDLLGLVARLGHEARWRRADALLCGQYRLVEAAAEAVPEAPSASSGQAPGYVRWAVVGPEQSCKAFLCAAEPPRPGISGRYWPLYTAQFLPQFGFFVFERVDDSGAPHTAHCRHLNMLWDKKAQRFTGCHAGAPKRAAYLLAEVEVVDPVAVLMRTG